MASLCTQMNIALDGLARAVELSSKGGEVVFFCFGATGKLIRSLYEYHLCEHPGTLHRMHFISDTDADTVSYCTHIPNDIQTVLISLSGKTAELIFYAKLLASKGMTPIIITERLSPLHELSIDINAHYIPIGNTSRISFRNNATLLLSSVLAITLDTSTTKKLIIKSNNVCIIAPTKFLGITHWFAHLWNEHMLKSRPMLVHNMSEIMHGMIEPLRRDNYSLFIFNERNAHITLHELKTLEQKLIRSSLPYNINNIAVDSYAEVAQLFHCTLKGCVTTPYSNHTTAQYKEAMYDTYQSTSNRPNARLCAKPRK